MVSTLIKAFTAATATTNTPTDLNDIDYLNLCMYNTSSTNRPSDCSYGLLLVISTDLPKSTGTGWVWQFATSTGDNSIRVRRRINNREWTDWQKFTPTAI